MVFGSITQTGSNPNGNVQLAVAYLGPLATHLEGLTPLTPAICRRVLLCSLFCVVHLDVGKFGLHTVGGYGCQGGQSF